MLEVTETARQELESYFTDREKEPIRVYLAHGGCGGPRLALALDAPGEEDNVFEQGAFTFCINKALLEKVEAVAIDLGAMGFDVRPRVPFAPVAGGSCGGCSGHCGG